IAKQRMQLEQQKVFKSNAGLTPTVRAFAGGEYAQNNLILELNTFGDSGAETQRLTEDLAFSMSHNAGVRIDYTLYNGGRGKYQLEQFQNFADLSTLQMRFTVENILLRVTQLYLMVRSLEQNEQLLKESIGLSKQRLAKTELASKYAKENHLSILRARTNLTTDSISLRNLQRDMVNTKKNLLQLLHIKEAYDFSTAALNNSTELPIFNQLRTTTLQSNTQILMARQGAFIEEQQLRIDETANLPQVDIFAGPTFLRQDFEVNQIKSSQTIGPSAGFSVNYLLLDGKRRQRNQAIQRLEIIVSKQEESLTTNTVLLELDQTWNNYRAIQEQLAFEQASLPFYEENLNQSIINNETGKISDTDVRAAQLNLLAAEVSVARLEIELQQTYFSLLKIAGLITTFKN
ncbi:MAG: TolC family protein, partial [Bacteroidota bacterium]